MSKGMLIRYIRDKGHMDGEKFIKGNPIGVIVSLEDHRIGISICNKKDHWNRKIGLEKAIDRAKYGDFRLFLNDIKNRKLKEKILFNLSKFDFSYPTEVQEI